MDFKKEELALGPAPTREEHILKLRDNKIKCILSLCSLEEAKPPDNMEGLFVCRRIVLPDHTYGRKMNIKELKLALDILEDLSKLGSIFVHCRAAIERSPILCMAWLIKKHGLNMQQSLNYLMSINKGTCPLNNQLNLLEELINLQ